MSENPLGRGPFERWLPTGAAGPRDEKRGLEAELRDVRYVVRTEEVYIGSGGPNAELHHLGGGRFELAWEVDDIEAARPLGRQWRSFDSRLAAEAFVREHAPGLYVGEGVEGVPLYPPTAEQLERAERVAAELGLR